MKKGIAFMWSILIAVLFSVFFLFLVAFLIYKLHIPEAVAGICVTSTYVVAAFLAGFFLAKWVKVQKFLWGILAGGCYFLIIYVLSLVLGEGTPILTQSGITAAILCLAGGMLGGMLG